MRLSDGRLALWCTHQRQAHIVHCTPHLLAPERLQLPSSFGGGLDLLGWLVNMGFCATLFGSGMLCSGGSKSALWSSGSGMAGAPALMATKHCILAASESVGGGTIHLRELGYAIRSSGPLAQVHATQSDLLYIT